MIVMNLKADNLFSFQDFEMNFSYPKKIVNSTIEKEHLSGHPNFRYKKVNIIMGANASGKTTLGKLLMTIFNFISSNTSKGNPVKLESAIQDKSKEASFALDFVPESSGLLEQLEEHRFLYRIEFVILPKEHTQKSRSHHLDDINSKYDIRIYKSPISKKDSYESCVKKLKEIPIAKNFSLYDKFSLFPSFGWFFSLTDESDERAPKANEMELSILEVVLKALDSEILSVKKSDEVENSFIIQKEHQKIIIQEGEVIKDSKLSSGTKAGIPISNLISAMRSSQGYGFYYCDEKFSFVHSEFEKAFLNIMIELLSEDNQFFFTTHNSDILKMNLPKHSFTFLKKDPTIRAVHPENYIKKNSQSLYSAVENDVFNCTPNIDSILDLVNPF